MPQKTANARCWSHLATLALICSPAMAEDTTAPAGSEQAGPESPWLLAPTVSADPKLGTRQTAITPTAIAFMKLRLLFRFWSIPVMLPHFL